MKASDLLAWRLQQNLCISLNPGVGRLRRAEAGICGGGRTIGGLGGPPFFCRRSHGNQAGNQLQESKHQRNYHAPAMRDDFPAAR